MPSIIWMRERLNQRSIRPSACSVTTMFVLSRSDAEMSDAFIKWCRASTTAQQFMGQAEKFSPVGVSLIHPLKKTGVLLDVDGNDVAATPAEMADIIDRRVGATISLEWWFSADTDLTCTYNFVPGGREIQTYYLDGLSISEVESARRVIVDLFWAALGASESLVIDTTGRSADFDWDEYLLYGVGVPSFAPDLLIVRANFPSSPPPHTDMRNLQDGFVEFIRRR